MASVSRFAFLALALVSSLTSARPFPEPRMPFTRRALTPIQAQVELGPLLSTNASIFGPNDTRWHDATERYNTFTIPHVQLVVQPGMEEDIPEIVRYANQNSVPFMAVNRGHALTSTVGGFTGLQIDMSVLTKIEYQPDMKTAWFQGGTYDQQVMEELWDLGYVATTGSCSCVGMMGPGLGGGHGRYQGMHGLISDNIVNLNVVLADGSRIRVNSTTNADLFWAMQGAGHNYGIVTSFELQIHPREVETWYYKNYIFEQDKLEPLFEKLNKFQNNGTQPKLMAANYGIYMLNKDISEDDAIIFWSFAYAGPQEDAEKLLEPFETIGHVWEEDGNVPFPEVPSAQGSGMDDPLCASGNSHIISTAGLQVYNITAQRQIFEMFNERVRYSPELSLARVVMEGYSVDAVRDADPSLSSFPLRDDYLLMYFDAEVAPNATVTSYARQWATDTRDLWNAGQPERLPTTYINYAAGDEPLESIYGYEPWRLEKLRSLKAQYDPDNKFRYYNPIIRD